MVKSYDLKARYYNLQQLLGQDTVESCDVGALFNTVHMHYTSQES